MIFDTLRHLLNPKRAQSLQSAYLETPQPEIFLRVGCRTCKQYHDIKASPANWLLYMDEWQAKHPMPLHDVEFRNMKRRIPRGLFDKVFQEFNILPWWLGFAENADIKIAYANSGAYTCGIESTPLASSSTGVLGRESAAVDNTTLKYLDYLVGGKITTGSSPTIGFILLFLYGSINDTPTYPDVLDGTDSDETFTSVGIRDACTSFFNEVLTGSGSNQTYWFRPQCISPFFGGVVPKFHGLFATHTTVAALNATGSNHVLNYTGTYVTG